MKTMFDDFDTQIQSDELIPHAWEEHFYGGIVELANTPAFRWISLMKNLVNSVQYILSSIFIYSVRNNM